MPKFVDVPFAVQEGNAGVTQNSQETLVNMYIELPTSGRSQIVRRQRPCLRSVYMITGEKRAIERHKGVHYCVIGGTFYSFDGISLTVLGALNTSTGRCTIIFNDLDEIMVCDGSAGYYWNGSTLALVTLPGGVTIGTLAYLGGFGTANDVGTGTFYATSPNDFSDFDALDFATAEANPDPLNRVFADHNELWLAGQLTIEIWQLSGRADFPYLPVTSAKIERGIAAPFSMASEAGTVFGLGDDLVVYRFDSYLPNRVSTQPIEEMIRNVTGDVADAYSLLFSVGGQKFYALTFPDELTVVLNTATGLWSVFKSPGSESWDVVGSAGKNSDYVMTAAGICELTRDLNTDENVSVIRLMKSATGDANGANIAMHELFVDCEVGGAAQGVEAEVMLRVARDGETFGNIRVQSLGTVGQYNKRAVWRGLGQGRKPVLELSASGDFDWAVMGTKLNADVSDS